MASCVLAKRLLRMSGKSWLNRPEVSVPVCCFLLFFFVYRLAVPPAYELLYKTYSRMDRVGGVPTFPNYCSPPLSYTCVYFPGAGSLFSLVWIRSRLASSSVSTIVRILPSPRSKLRAIASGGLCSRTKRGRPGFFLLFCCCDLTSNVGSLWEQYVHWLA